MPFGRPEISGDGEQEEQPLNTIVIESEQATDVLWEAIRSKLRKGLWALLANLPLPDEDSELICDQRKMNLLHNLCFLYPANEIWKGYKNYRRKQVDQYVRNESLLQCVKADLLGPCEGEVPDDVVSFVKLCRAVELMIYEDAMILQEGIFPESVPSFEFIHGSYLVTITHELQAVCESFGVNKTTQEQGSFSEVERPSARTRGSHVLSSKLNGERQSGGRRGSNVSSGKVLSEEQESGSRRGSCVSTGKQSDTKENLLIYKLCFTAMVALERLVQIVTSQRPDTEGTGKAVCSGNFSIT